MVGVQYNDTKWTFVCGQKVLRQILPRDLYRTNGLEIFHLTRNSQCLVILSWDKIPGRPSFAYHYLVFSAFGILEK